MGMGGALPGELAPVSLGLLGKARELSEQLGGGGVAAVLAGTDSEEAVTELMNYGADRVYLADDPSLNAFDTESCARLVSSLVQSYNPEIFLWGATSLGSEIAARVAAGLETGLIAHCIDLSIEKIEGIKQLAAVVVGWGGNITIRVICPKKRPQMATAKSGIFTLPKPVERKGEVIRVEVGEGTSRLDIVEVEEAKESETTLEEAEAVVAGGWGMNCLGDFKPAEELAQLLGGGVGGTRPAVDAGWIPHEKMIGQSGITVAPRLLVTLGVSGAAQFATTVMGSRVILAVDKNPRAPIFEMADIGIVGDLQEVLPLLISKIEVLKGGKQGVL